MSTDADQHGALFTNIQTGFGWRCVGKTAFAKRMLTGEFEEKYIATMGVEVHPVILETTPCKVGFNVWDIAGQKQYQCLLDGYILHTQAAIIMFDVSSRSTYNNVPFWYSELRRIAGDDFPIVLCGNKVDVDNRRVKAKTITFHREKQLQYYDISVETLYNFKKPLLWLARKISGNSSLDYLQHPSSEAFVKDLEPGLKTTTAASEKSSSQGTKTIGPETSESEDNNVVDNLDSLNLEHTSEKNDREIRANNLNKHDATGLSSAITTEEFNVFVLCVYCTRMILIQSTLSANIANLNTSSPVRFSLVTTTCRGCKQSQSGRPLSNKVNELSRDTVEKTRMYDCVCKVADEAKVVPLGDSMVLSVPVEELVNKLSTDCRVCGICTSASTLRRLDELDKESLVLRYLPGAFL